MFELGTEIVLEIDRKTSSSRLLGWKFISDRKLLFLANPGASSGFLAPLAGQTVVMRMESHGVMTGFEAVYLDTLKKTDLMLFIVSQDIVIKKLRNDERFFCFLPVELVSPATGEVYCRGMINNLSVGGAALGAEVNAGLGADHDVLLNFNAGGLGEVKGLRMKIARARSMNQRWIYSGNFIDVSKEQKEPLERFFDFYRRWRVN